MTKTAEYKIERLCLHEMDSFLRETYDGAVKTVWAVGSPYSLGSGWNIHGTDISAHRHHEEKEKDSHFQVRISGENIEKLCADVENRFRGLEKIEAA